MKLHRHQPDSASGRIQYLKASARRTLDTNQISWNEKLDGILVTAISGSSVTNASLNGAGRVASLNSQAAGLSAEKML
jgi:hypothetical protein